MSLALPPPFVLMTNGTSETYGRLAAYPYGWAERLAVDLPQQPEAVGQVVVIPRGHGGWTSLDVLNDITVAAASERVTHALIEPGDINSCVVSGGVPVYDRATKTAHVDAMVAALQAANPAIDITLQTMNPVSAGGAGLRPNLADYYADTIARAGVLGIGALDNYAAWPKPLPEWMSFCFDGLHPVWANAVEIYHYRAVLFLMRQKMAAWWGLAAPSAPAYGAAPDVRGVLIAGGGAGGGGNSGGGGGAGEVVAFLDTWANLLGAVSLGLGGVYNGATPGPNGSDSTVGAYRAKGGGGGGLYNGTPTEKRGGDGSNSGGAGNSATPNSPGTPRYGRGNIGGKSAATTGNGAGAGGGCVTPGADATGVDGGAPGLGWHTDYPGGGEDVGGAGPGGSLNGARPAYGLGGGPSCPGGGGKGGALAGAGDSGGLGKLTIWYPGAPRGTGGTIVTAGGFTTHTFTASGTLA